MVSFVIIIAVLFVFFGFLTWTLPLVSRTGENIFFKKIVLRAPYPAVIVGSDYVSVSRVAGNLASVRKFYESQDFSKLGLRVDFSTEEGKKRLKIKEKEILNKLIEESVIKKEARERKIVISQEITDQAVDRKLKEYGTGDNLTKNLEKLYGWGLDDFKKSIVKPDLYKEKLMESIRESDPNFKKALDKIKQAENELNTDNNFFEIAKKYSEGESAQLGGELGWFDLGQMMPEIAVEVMFMEKGQTSQIIQSSIGYHIVRLEDRKTEDKKELFELSQIFVRTQAFSDWLLETEKKYKIYIPLKEFYWDAKLLEVKFSDSAMNEYEKKIRESPTNDPSVW